MTFPLPSDVLSAAFVAACRAEIGALKPGNVHVHGAGHGMEASHFEDAAQAAAPWIANGDLVVGERVLRAVGASFDAAGLNTNLGIVLLCVPLAAAAGAANGTDGLRRRLAKVLAALDREDAVNVFQAIVRANPAGLGRAGEQDVAAPPTATLRAAMALAASRDRIARAYVTDYEDIFDFGLPQLELARRHAKEEDEAISTLHMSYLAAYPDSHIVRKHGTEAALEVQEAARKRERLWRPAASRDTFAELLDFDRELKAKGYNPGTTADFVVATLYADTLITLGVTKCGA
jgi:triphosphoribosyl-dephospho-CoA synthase